MNKTELKACPYCGKDARFIKEGKEEDYFYIISCPDINCKGYNENTFDDREACISAWNATVNPEAESEGDEDEG